MGSGGAGKGIGFVRAHFLSFFIFKSTKHTYVQKRGQTGFRFQKPRVHAQTLKSEDNSTIRLQNMGSDAIAPRNYLTCK
jgi:hypothetical protein